MDDPGTRIDRLDAAGDTPGFLADAVMPAQFFPARCGAAAVEPVMRLMSAILIDAVRCLQRNFETHDPSRQQEFREAQSWIFDDIENGPFAFEEVFDTLGIGVSAAGLISGSRSYIHRRRRLREVVPLFSALAGAILQCCYSSIEPLLFASRSAMIF
jgi:hypothetical protein